MIFHSSRVVIGGGTNIGRNAHLFTNVNFGLRSGGYPTLGDGVTVFANAVITGNIVIGDDAVISPNSVVLGNVAARTVVAGAQATPVRTRRPPVDSTRQFGEPGSEQG